MLCPVAGVFVPLAGTVMRSKRAGFVTRLIVGLLFAGSASAGLFAAENVSTKIYAKDYRFTKNSFTDKVTAWSKILDSLKGKPGLHYLEIGTYEGRSALWMLENILTHPTAHLTVIDAFEEHTHARFMSNVKLSGEANKFDVKVGPSTDKIREVALNSIDLAYVDGSGRGILMLSDLVATWHVTKVGGIIICSRYNLTPALRRALNLRAGDPGPHEAIDTFVKMFGPYLTVLASKGNYVVVRKVRS